MKDTDSLVGDLKSRLNSRFYRIEESEEEGIIGIKGRTRFYKKFKDIVSVLKLNSEIMIHYYDEKVEDILIDLRKEYKFEYQYVEIRMP